MMKENTTGRTRGIRSFVILLASVFVFEFLVHRVLLQILGIPQGPMRALVDSVALLLILSPILYYFSYRPMSEELRERSEAEERFRQIFDSSPHALFAVVESTGEFALMNSRVRDIFGYRSEELVGKKVEALVPERLREKHVQERLEYMGNPMPLHVGPGRDLFGLHKNGTEIPVEISLTPMPTPRGLQILTTVTDISERKKLEKERDVALQAREELLTFVSHEIRNPLTAINASVQIMQKLLPDIQRRPEFERLLRQLLSASQRMTRITSDILESTRIESGIFAIEPDRVETGHLLREAFDLFEPLALQKSIRLELNVPGEVPALQCDRHRILQVLSNLLSNALKFTPDGGRIELTAAQTGDRVRVAVKDSGKGIPREEVPHVFEKFWQARQARKAGAGLGLYISKYIVNAHGGEIGVESEPGKGTTFYFALPARAVSAKAAA